MTLNGTAAALPVDDRKSRHLIREGQLSSRQSCKEAAWIISAVSAVGFDRLRTGERRETPRLAMPEEIVQPLPGREEPGEV